MKAHALRRLIEIAEKYGNLNDPIITTSSRVGIHFDLPTKDVMSAKDIGMLNDVGIFWSEYEDCWMTWTQGVMK